MSRLWLIMLPFLFNKHLNEDISKLVHLHQKTVRSHEVERGKMRIGLAWLLQHRNTDI